MKKTASLIPIAAGACAAAALLVFCAGNLGALSDFFLGSFSSRYYFGAALNTACLLMAAGLGDSLALSAGECNLGGEGQIYAGGFVCAVILDAARGIPAPLALSCAFFASLAAPAFMASVSAALKKAKGADILLTTYIVSAAAIPAIDSLVSGKFRGDYGNLLATPFISETFRSPRVLPPSPLSLAALAASALCAACHFFMSRTTSGKRIAIAGASGEFARCSGIDGEKIKALSLAAAAAMHGFAGFIAVTGTYFTCHAGFYSGLGWNALIAALAARANPLSLIPSCLLLSLLFTSADRTALNFNMGFDASALLQGVVLLCVAARKKAGAKNE